MENSTRASRRGRGLRRATRNSSNSSSSRLRKVRSRVGRDKHRLDRCRTKARRSRGSNSKGKRSNRSRGNRLSSNLISLSLKYHNRGKMQSRRPNSPANSKWSMRQHSKINMYLSNPNPFRHCLFSRNHNYRPLSRHRNRHNSVHIKGHRHLSQSHNQSRLQPPSFCSPSSCRACRSTSRRSRSTSTPWRTPSGRRRGRSRPSPLGWSSS